MKTRQQRLTEARAGRPPSPPQSLPYNQREPRHTRAKPSATVVARPVVPAAQSAVQGEAQSLLYVWVDAGPEASGRPVNDPTHKLAIPSSSVPALIAFIENLRNQNKQSHLPAEEEHFPAMGSTDRDEGEARQAGTEKPTAEQTIRSPSRTLDTMNKNKRKHWGDEVDIPSPEAGNKSYGSPEEEGVTEEQPGKIRRTKEQGGFSSRIAGDLNNARQYVGLNAQHTNIEYQGGNAFTEYYEAAHKVANDGQQFLEKTPIPITYSTGTLKVPSPGHSDRSESKNDEEGVTAGSQAVTPSHQKRIGLRSGSPALWQSKLSKPEEILRPAEVEALRKLRDRVEKYKASLPARRLSPA